MYKVTVPIVITNGHFNKEKTLAAIKGAGIQRIALALEREIGYAFSSEENLQLLRELIEYYKDNGLEVIVWLGETIGHSGGKPFDNVKYRSIRNIEEGDISAFCPRDESFIEDCCAWIRKVAMCGAEMILVDDDFRLGRRGNIGCCCELHMKDLEKELGESISEDEIRMKVFSGGKNKYRDSWLKVQGDSLRNLARRMRETLDEVNPGARMGLCCCTDSWDVDGTSCIELAKIMAGNTRPFVRFTGGPFWVNGDNEPTIGDVVEYVRMQASWCKDENIEVFSEGDTYPRPRFTTPASRLECFDMLLRADGQTAGILKYMLDYVSDADYEPGYIDRHIENTDLYREIEKCFGNKRAVGVKPYSERHLIEDAELDGTDKGILRNIEFMPIYNKAVHFAVRNSLPITYEKDGVNIVFGENARHISIEELDKGAIIDVTAARIFAERGIDTGIRGYCKNDIIRQSFSDVPEEYFVEEGIYTRLSPVSKVHNLKIDEKAQVITEYRIGSLAYPGVFHYENQDGKRFVVYPIDAEKSDKHIGWFAGYARRRQLEKSIEWLSGNKLAVTIGGDYPMLYVMAKEDSEGMAVALCNLFDDKIKNATVNIERNVKEIRFINCKGRFCDGKVVLDTVLYPYEFVGFELKF